MPNISDIELDDMVIEQEKFEEVADRYGLDLEAFEAFCDNQHIKGDECEDAVSDFRDAYIGEYSNTAQFAEEYHYENGDLDRIPANLDRYIDWDGVWEGELRHDFYEINGYYFRNI